jgi:hypothetical protein
MPNPLRLIRLLFLIQLASLFPAWANQQHALVAPPNENSLPDIIRWVFESNKCVATEEQLYDPIANNPNFGAAVANQAVIDTSNSEDVTVISRNPYTYRFSGSPLCKENNAQADKTEINIVLPIQDNGWFFDSESEYKPRAFVCDGDEVNTSCLSLSCMKDGNLKFVWFFSGGDIVNPISAQIRIDGEIEEEIILKPHDQNSELRAESAINSISLSKLKKGSKVMIAMLGKGHQFSLRGSNRAIQQVERACNGDSPTSVDTSAIIKKEIKIACDSGRGKIDPRGVIIRDLNNDGQADAIIGHDAVSCSGSMSRSMFCGAQVCSTKIYLGENGKFFESTDMLGILESVSSGNPPTLNFYTHGGSKVKIRWNGARFAKR